MPEMTLARQRGTNLAMAFGCLSMILLIANGYYAYRANAGARELSLAKVELDRAKTDLSRAETELKTATTDLERSDKENAAKHGASAADRTETKAKIATNTEWLARLDSTLRRLEGVVTTLVARVAALEEARDRPAVLGGNGGRR